MSIQNGERLATKQDLADFYNDIRPYMGGLVSSKAGFTPIGTIISVMGTTAPVNYLACDGTVYNIADYTELANYFNEQFGSKNFFGGDGTTTFAVPSLQGEFLRGAGTNTHANQGNGAAVGVHQDASTIPQVGDNGTNLIISKNKWTEHADSSIRDRTDNVCRYVGTQEGTTVTQSYMLRPTNTSVLYCIATKNFYIDPTLDYSTDEKVVGTWINGEPLYQRTIVKPLVELTHSSLRWIYVYSEIISTIDKLVSVSMVGTSKYSTNPICTFYGSAFNSDGSGGTHTYAMFDNDSHTLFFYIYTSAEMTNTSVIATIQYTKTSD